MKIEVLGKDVSAVHSVYINRINFGLQAIITVSDRNYYVHRCGASIEFIKSYGTDISPQHQAFEILKNEDVLCEIVLIPENQEELKLVRYFDYLQKCKDQWVYLFIDYDFEESVNIAEWRS